MRRTVGHGTVGMNISYFWHHLYEIFILFRKKCFGVLILEMLEGPYLLGWSSHKVKKSAWDSGTWDSGGQAISINKGVSQK